MNLIFKKATIDDLNFLVETRIEVLKAANKLDDSVDMSLVTENSYDYYEKSIKTENHIAYLVFDNDNFVGTGGISIYCVMPTYLNPSGIKGYIMNMYIRRIYRRQGIALKILDLLVHEAKCRGISFISLETTDMGKSLYKKYGFQKMEDEMILSN